MNIIELAAMQESLEPKMVALVTQYNEIMTEYSSFVDAHNQYILDNGGSGAIMGNVFAQGEAAVTKVFACRDCHEDVAELNTLCDNCNKQEES